MLFRSRNISRGTFTLDHISKDTMRASSTLAFRLLPVNAKLVRYTQF
jgi:hypothetical protein